MPLVATLVLAMVLWGCGYSTPNAQWKPFVPAFLRDGTLVSDESVLSDTLRESISQVLSYYGHHWKMMNDTLYCQEPLSEELLWNFTSKAQDSTWLATHIAPLTPAPSAP